MIFYYIIAPGGGTRYKYEMRSQWKNVVRIKCETGTWVGV